MDNTALIPHLFRTEFRKIIAVLCKRFGFDHMGVAEDIAAETFLTAAQTWGIKGNPGNPVAWLHNVARNKAINYLRRKDIFDNKIVPELNYQRPEVEEIDLSLQNIIDSQLQMMFAVCHPSISPEAQISLSLRVLCGFGIDEIAGAFLVSKETVNKRLSRAKEKLRSAKIKMELPNAGDIGLRLETVLTTIYLLFNEGYYSAGQHTTVRKELCLEAMRLCTMLIENPQTNTPAVNALLSLMCFHASRFDARLDPHGEIILYEEQDTSLWNSILVSKGGYFLHCAARGDTISPYHLEAGIAYWNTVRTDTREKWENILQLYDQLLLVKYSPVAALNRAFALSKVKGKLRGIAAAEALQLVDNNFYFALLGELYTGVDNDKAKQHFVMSMSLAKTPATRQAIQKKIDSL